MSEPTFEVASASLLTIHSQHVEQVRSEIVGQLKTLVSELEPLAVHWQGPAATAFQRLKAAYSTQQIGICKVLSEVAEQLSGSQKTYNTADADSQDALTRIQSTVFTLTPGQSA